MTGIHEEAAAIPRTGQPAAVLSAWIDEQLREIQSSQVARFVQLRAKLQSDAFEWDGALLCRAIELWCAGAAKLNFEPLRKRGWWVRLRGSPGRRAFVEQYKGIVEAAKNAQACSVDLVKTYRADTSGARRVLVELEMEQQSMAREVAQAVEWLAEMSEDLAVQLHKSGPEPALALLMKRVEFFASHLKVLAGLQDMAEAICVLGLSVLERRNALLEQLKVDMDGFDKVWLRRVGPIAEHAGERVLPGLDKAEAAHAELASRLVNTHAASEALQLEEHSFGLRLSAMRKELEELT